jgi:thiamine-monophosphate kinase
VKNLNDIGERKAIENIKEVLSKYENIVEIGDDCAILEQGDYLLLVTTDMINEKTHIPNIMSPWQIGWFVVSISLSDIAAKGGKPLGLVLALGLPGETSELFLKNLMNGANACANSYLTSIIGGDTKENPNITICSTAIGWACKDDFMPRIGMKGGEIVALTGPLGGAGAGLYAYKHNVKDKNFFEKFLEPRPRVFEGIELAKTRTVSSCMDISDGLSSSLYQLSDLNNVGFELFMDRIPISETALNVSKLFRGFDAYNCAVHCGGDYELLLTVSKADFELLRSKMEKSGFRLFDIGIVTDEKEIIINSNGKREIVEKKGYEHFI